MCVYIHILLSICEYACKLNYYEVRDLLELIDLMIWTYGQYRKVMRSSTSPEHPRSWQTKEVDRSTLAGIFSPPCDANDTFSHRS